MASTSKYLARSNKTGSGGKATKKRDPPKEAVSVALCVLPEDDFTKP
jgi:hypothetical protein